MMNDHARSVAAAKLRREAEARLKATRTPKPTARSAQDARRLVHELQVHQIELEMQNEELVRSQAIVEAGLERYADLFDFAPVGYLSLGRDGTIRQVNQTGASLLRTERALLEGRRFGLYVVEGNRLALSLFLQKNFAGGGKDTCEVSLIKKKNPHRRVWIEATLDKNGLECRFAVMDITQRKQAEDMLQTQQAELAHFSRVSALGEMAACLAHELNQPLGAILNYSGVCLDMTGGSPPTRSPDMAGLLRNIVSEANRASEIIKRHRAFMRKQPPAHRVYDINKIVGEAIGLMEPQWRRLGLRPNVRLAGDLPSVRVDAVQIEQVLVNLFQNAIEAMADCQADSRNLVVVTAPLPPDHIRVRVTDSGHGIPVDMLSKVFEAFFTTKTNGLGMGLAISRSIIEGHGGRLTVTSKKSRGATFELMLPAVSRG